METGTGGNGQSVGRLIENTCHCLYLHFDKNIPIHTFHCSFQINQINSRGSKTSFYSFC